MNVKLPLLTLPAVCALTLLAGCFGGKGGSSHASDNRPSENVVETPADSKIVDSQAGPAEGASGIDLTGNVVKGIVNNAVVRFYSIEEGVIVDQPFAETVSDASGAFHWESDSALAAELLYVEVTGATDGASTMLCDAITCGNLDVIDGVDENGNGQIDFGEIVNLTSDFKLSTIISEFESLSSFSFSVTPLSHIAAQQVLSSGEITVASVRQAMTEVAEKFGLTLSLSQVVAVDITAIDDSESGEVVESSPDAELYGFLSSMFANYAASNGLTIAQTIDFFASNLIDENGGYQREIVLALLSASLENVRHVLALSNDPHLLTLVTTIQQAILQYHCDIDLLGEEQCAHIPPVVTPTPDNGLQLTKAFVSDVREMVRSLSNDSSAAIDTFTQRTDAFVGIWEYQVKDLTSAFDDVLAGVVDVIARCYSCSYPFQREHNGLIFTLNADGRLSVEGEVKALSVDIAFQLPELSTWRSWDDFHQIEVISGLIGRDNSVFVIRPETQLSAQLRYSRTFDGFLRDAQSWRYSKPESVAATLSFYVQNEYDAGSLVALPPITFEASDFIPDSVSFSGDWYRTPFNVNGSSNYAFRARDISDRQSSRSVLTFETTRGGTVSFDYAVDSESRYDYLYCYLNGVRKLSVAGRQRDFRSLSFDVPPGEHTLEWRYVKDRSVSHGADTAWIDNIRLPITHGIEGNENGEIVTDVILDGTAHVSVEKLESVWLGNQRDYLPSTVQIRANWADAYNLDSGDTGRDRLSVDFTANIANASDFVPPEALEDEQLVVLGNYVVEPNRFQWNMPHQRIVIERADAFSSDYTVSYYVNAQSRISRDATIEDFVLDRSYTDYHYAAGTPMDVIAERFIFNSGIGVNIVISEEGVYETSLINTSRKGSYRESQFLPSGGMVFGTLVQPYLPEETSDSFLHVDAALEVKAHLEGLGEVAVGTRLNREHLDNGELAFYLEYDGKRLNIESNFWYSPQIVDSSSYFPYPYRPVVEDREAAIDLPSLTMSNREGVELKLTLNEEGELDEKISDSVEGVLTYNGVQYATIESIRGFTVVRYIDGENESIQ